MSIAAETSIDLQALLDTAVEAATQAGSLIHERVGQDIDIKYKEDGIHNLVTEMDTAAEALIQQIITTRHGESIFLAEESGGNEALTELTWVIDPIDGTVNYAHGVPIYCISIAAVRGNEPLIGVIYNPNTSELFTAIKGEGAWLNGKQLQVSTNADLSNAILVTGFPYNVQENPYGCVDAFASLVRMGIPVRRLGSAALDLAYVAAGRFDAYWEVALNAWDVAAGALMVIEAGGSITTYARETASGLLIVDRLLATNGKLDAQLTEVLQRTF